MRSAARIDPPAASSGRSEHSADLDDLDPGDVALIDEMLALTPAERLFHLEATLRSLEALHAATGSPLPAE